MRGWMTIACFWLLIAGCDRTEKTPSEEASVKAQQAATVLSERGPVSVSVSVIPEKPRLSDEPELTLTVRAEAGVDVSLPEFGESVGDFLIRDFHEPIPRTEEGSQILQQVYTLEPETAGRVVIDPFVVSFTDNRKEGDGKEHSVETEPLRLTISTMLDANAPSLDDLEPPAPPTELESTDAFSMWWLFWLAGGSAIVVVIVMLIKRRTAKPEPPIPPGILARRELDELIASGLSSQDVKLFYVELTAIVRRYIERTTSVRAPELTTEEFLRQVEQQALFRSEDNVRLVAFLEAADLVKFAGVTPDEEAIRQATHKAKVFIELKSPESGDAA